MGDTLDPDAEGGENALRQFSEPDGEGREGKGRAPYVHVETIILIYGSRQAFHGQFGESKGIRCPRHLLEL